MTQITPDRQERAAPQPVAWVCPWGICNHQQAQECRTEMRNTRRHRGCGTYFPAGTTPEQAKQMIAAPTTEEAPKDRE
jgi:hypothetical protein